MMDFLVRRDAGQRSFTNETPAELLPALMNADFTVYRHPKLTRIRNSLRNTEVIIIIIIIIIIIAATIIINRTGFMVMAS